MALTQVAGPFAYVSIEAGNTLVTTHGMWMDRLGGMVVLSDAGSTAQGDLNILKPDGAFVRIGQRGLIWAGVGYSYDDYFMLRHPGSSAGVSGLKRIYVPGLAETGAIYDYYTFTNWALMSDRVLRFNGNNVTRDLLSGGGTTTECVITTLQPATGRIFPCDLSQGRQLWWLCNTSTGNLYLYDANAQAEVSGRRTGFGMAVSMACYSRKHDIFGVIVGGQLRIFANEPVAATLSVPSFNPAPVAGKFSTVSVTLLGSHGEPCQNRVIGFSPTAGNVTREYTTTNASGVANTTYRAPFNAIAAQDMQATLVE